MLKTMSSRARAAVAVLAFAGALTLSACTGIPTGSTTAAPTASTTAAPTATPMAAPDESAPVRAVDLAAGEQAEPVEVDVDGGADGVGVTFREITIAPGGSTGEHCHYGQLVAVVSEGELTHYSETHPGGVRAYAAGEAIVEGAGYPHEGRNEGDTDVVLWVTYIIPDGKPLAETDLANCDG